MSDSGTGKILLFGVEMTGSLSAYASKDCEGCI